MNASTPFNFASDAWFLTGPTAAGKTRIGLELAALLDAEIVSLDSMAIYREMNIGTAKPTAEEQSRGKHHLIDIVSPDAEYSLAEYVDDAREVSQEIRARGKQVLFVGGTPLYLKSLLRGVDAGPPPDWEFRNQVTAEVAEVGVEALHARLAQVDPLAAAKLHPHDQRRIIRALEVYKATREPLSHRQTHFERGKSRDATRVFVLQWPRPELHRRIEARVERMFEIGLVDEARGLLERYPQLSRTALQAVGYREAFALLRGEASLVETIEQVKIRTRRFARRQETWFRGLSECRPVPLAVSSSPADVAQQIAASA
jgi:tRNA dimethylallyltransferase